MLKRTLIAAAALALGAGFLTPAANAAPTHNETTLSLFSCAATRSGTGHPNMTINHSHRIAADSVTGHIDAFDCEGFDNPGLDGCVWRVYYVYDNKLNGSDLGILEPVNITCFGF